MDNISAVVINYSREIIPAPTLDFEMGKIGLPHLKGNFGKYAFYAIYPLHLWVIWWVILITKF